MNTSYSILVLFLIITSNYLAELFPCRVQYSIENNMVIRHIFGFLTMVFFVSLSGNTQYRGFSELLMTSFKMYIGFIMLTKSNITFFFVSILILAVSYLLSIKKDMINNVDRETLESYELYIYDNYENIQNILTKLLIGSLIIGTMIYFGEKRIEYRKGFSYQKFVFGNINCKHSSPPTTMYKALKSAMFL